MNDPMMYWYKKSGKSNIKLALMVLGVLAFWVLLIWLMVHSMSKFMEGM